MFDSEFESWWEQRKNFLLRVNFVCWLLFDVHLTSMLLQWHIKDPGHSAKSASGRLHLNMHTPLIQRSRSGLTTLLCRYSVGTYQEMSSNTTHQGTLSHSCFSSLSGISVRYLISTKKKKMQAGNELSSILPKSLHVWTNPHTDTQTEIWVP